jgi:hypothetical protein
VPPVSCSITGPKERAFGFVYFFLRVFGTSVKLSSTENEVAPVGRAASVDGMRWQELFADLEGQARSLEANDLDSEVADRTRAELAGITVESRLRAHLSRQVTLSVAGAGDVSGTLQRIGGGWLLLATPDETVIPLSAILAAWNLQLTAISKEGGDPLGGRVSLTAVIRAVARDRSPVVIRLRDGKSITGTPERVGADFVDVSVHDLDVAPRQGQIRARATVSFAAIALLHRKLTGWA